MRGEGLGVRGQGLGVGRVQDSGLRGCRSINASTVARFPLDWGPFYTSSYAEQPPKPKP